ncbi:MAG: hypothetical protein MNPFHGCM_00214 [Gemmatimonadaceae bacterium]|nr:hypothetical protein [Gemmatimonadaceae bacterium]
MNLWVGIAIRIMTVIWFVSGMAMMYHTGPAFTAQERLQALKPVTLGPLDTLIDFATARRALPRGTAVTRARVMNMDGRVVYALYAEDGEHLLGLGLVDASDGRLLSPISAEQAARTARASQSFSGDAAVELLVRGDRYFMGAEARGDFPVYRVAFADAGKTSVYVSARTGETVARVDGRARATTWIGVVPHRLYFQALCYDRFEMWLWLGMLVPGAAMAIAIADVVMGLIRVVSAHRDGGQPTGYNDEPRWLHLFGVVGGVLVFMWTLSGMLKATGASATPSPTVLARARGDTTVWAHPTLQVTNAVRRVLATAPGDSVLAVDLLRADDRSGYLVLLQSGSRVWVDAITGAMRRGIDRREAERVARHLLQTAASVVAAEYKAEADAFHRTTGDREPRLPAWRVAFADDARTSVYLDPATALPTAVVDDGVRRWGWWRDRLHSLDFPVLAKKRPLREAVILPLMLIGTAWSLVGVWLSGRHLWRWRAPAQRERTGESR